MARAISLPLIASLIAGIVLAANCNRAFGSEIPKPKRIIGCGEQCVQVLFEYFGIPINENYIISVLAPDERGVSSFSNLAKCLKSSGLEVSGFRCSAEDLLRVKDPMVLYVQPKKSEAVGHFVVVMWSKQRQHLLAYDPAMSGAPIDWQEAYSKAWTGEGILVTRSVPASRSIATIGAGLGALFLSYVLARACVTIFRGRPKRAAASAAMLLVTVAGSNVVQAQEVNPVPATEMVSDLGTVPGDAIEVRPAFSFKNDLPSPIEIEQVVRSCQCTDVHYPAAAIAPGETAKLSATIQLQQWKGHVTTEFLVTFKGNKRAPLLCKVKFFRATPLTADPDRLSFGRISPAAKETRSFRLVWAAEDVASAIHLEPPIKTEHGRVLCVFDGEKDETVTVGGADKTSYIQRFTFVVSPVATATAGQLDDRIRLQFSVAGVNREVTVPIEGEILSDVYAVPARVAIVAGQHNAWKHDIRIQLRRLEGVSVSDAITVVSTDKRLQINSDVPTDRKDSDVIRELRVSIPKEVEPGRTESEIVVHYSNQELHIPVRLVVLKEK